MATGNVDPNFDPASAQGTPLKTRPSIFDNPADPIEDLFNQGGKILFGEDTGELDISGMFDTADDEADDSEIPGDESTEVPAETSNNLNPEFKAFESKISNLENTIEKLGLLVVALTNGKAPAAPAEEEDPTDYSDPRALKQMISQTVRQAVQEMTGSINQDVEAVKLRQEYDSAVARFGEDFTKVLPQVGELMKTDPKWTFHTAYEFIAKLRGPAPKDSSIHNPQKVQPKVDVAQMRSRATAVKSAADGGVQAAERPSTRPKSVDEALDRALASLNSRR